MGKYKNAFNCKRCPQSNDQSGCPAWVEYTQENVVSGESRIQKECLFQALPVFLTEVIKASNRPAAAVESTRNEIASGFDKLNQVMAHGLALGGDDQSAAGRLSADDQDD